MLSECFSEEQWTEHRERKGMANWTDAKVLRLIELWGEEGIQEQLEGAKWNKHVFEKLAKELQKMSSNKTADQCRTKMKKLKSEYRKIVDKHSQTGQGRTNWKYFDAMDVILGHRPTTRPSVVVDTLATAIDPEENEGGEDGGMADEVCAQEDSFGSTEKNGHAHPSPSPSPGIGKKRKRTKDERVEAVLNKVVKEVVEAQRESDKMFLELEEKRMNHEANQRREEREFQLRMMSMLLARQGPHVSSESFGPYTPFSRFSDSSDYSNVQ